MAFSSSRLAIANGLVQMLEGITNPATSQLLYQAVKLGSVWDPSIYTGLWAEVLYSSGKSGPVGSGGQYVGWRIEDDPVFMLNSYYDYEADSTAAMTNLLTVMDLLLPVIHSHYLIPAPGNPTQPIASVYSLLEAEQNDHMRPLRYPQGRVMLMWSTYVVCKQQYSVQLVTP